MRAPWPRRFPNRNRQIFVARGHRAGKHAAARICLHSFSYLDLALEPAATEDLDDGAAAPAALRTRFSRRWSKQPTISIEECTLKKK